MNKAFVCIHGFGDHPGGRRHGFSYRLRDNVTGILGNDIVWKEVLWDDLLESPPKEPLTDFVFQTPEIVREFYGGLRGTAVRERVAEAVRTASAEAGGASVVLVGHSFGGAIAYDVLARRLAPEVKALVMLAPPMGLFNHPEKVVRNAAGRRLGWVRFLGRFGLDRMAANVVGFPKVEGGRLPAGFSAQSFRSDRDLYAVPLAPEFHDVGEMTIRPPHDTHGSANHRFYWKSPEVAATVANAGSTPAAGRLA